MSRHSFYLMLMLCFLYKQWRDFEFRSPVAGPWDVRGWHHQRAHNQQRTVIVDSPSGEIFPSLFVVWLDGYTGNFQFMNQLVIVGASDTDGRFWVFGVVWVRNIKIICDAMKTNKTSPNAQSTRHFGRNIN